MPIDFRKYTVDEAAKQLALLEIHLRQFDENSAIFCMECSGKHLLAIEGLADEGVGFFPEEPEPWKLLAQWSRDIREVAMAAGAKLKKDVVARWADECRLNRKELQATYMGSLGGCDCVSGLEPCCGAGHKQGV